jgi:predicted nucleotidyltransferase
MVDAAGMLINANFPQPYTRDKQAGAKVSGMDQFPRTLLATWAGQQPEIRALHVFGSRAKGTASRFSDLDIALEIDGPAEECLLVFLDNREQWRGELSVLTGIPVKDLELCGASSAVRECVQVFRRR